MSNLLTVRQDFIRTTGRWDLVTSTAATVDNGADAWVNRACKWLEDNIDRPGARQWTNHPIGDPDSVSAAYSIYVPVSGALTVDRVVLVSDTTTYAPTDLTDRYLDPMDFDAAIGPMAVEVFEDASLVTIDRFQEAVTRGIPLYWTIKESVRYYDEAESDNAGDTTDGPLYLLFYPLPEVGTAVRIWGKRTPTTLVNNTDGNWWTRANPHVVTMAAAMLLEETMANTARQRAYRETVMGYLSTIDDQAVERENIGREVRLGGRARRY